MLWLVLGSGAFGGSRLRLAFTLALAFLLLFLVFSPILEGVDVYRRETCVEVRRDLEGKFAGRGEDERTDRSSGFVVWDRARVRLSEEVV